RVRDPSTGPRRTARTPKCRRGAQAATQPSVTSSAPGSPCGLRARSRFPPGVLVDKLSHAVDAAAPQLLVLVEPATRDAQSREVGPDDFAAPAALFGDQAGPLQDGDVFLHR